MENLRGQDSNLRPPAYEAGELPDCSTSQYAPAYCPKPKQLPGYDPWRPFKEPSMISIYRSYIIL